MGEMIQKPDTNPIIIAIANWFGWSGLGYFLMGQKKKAIISIIIFLVGGTLTCGLLYMFCLVTAYDASVVVTSMRSIDLSPRMVAQLQQAGVTVIVYTLNTPTLWQKARQAGVDVIVTDDPRGMNHWADWLGS